MIAPLQTDRSTALIQRGLRLEYATLGWNVIGCWIVLASAYAARSVALAGFGIDSVIEIFASLVVVWQLQSVNKEKEHLAERLIGLAFFLLAAYLTVQSAIVLLTHFHPRTSLLGMAWLAFTCAAMLLLAWGKGRAGRELGNPVLVKESKVTVVDGCAGYLAHPRSSSTGYLGDPGSDLSSSQHSLATRPADPSAPPPVRSDASPPDHRPAAGRAATGVHRLAAATACRQRHPGSHHPHPV